MQRIILPILAIAAVAVYVRWAVKDIQKPNEEERRLVAETDVGFLDLGPEEDYGLSF